MGTQTIHDNTTNNRKRQGQSKLPPVQLKPKIVSLIQLMSREPLKLTTPIPGK